MAATKEWQEHANSLMTAGFLMAPMPNRMMTIFAEVNGTLLESFAKAQKDWAEFLDRRIKDDVAVSRQLMNCQSLADMHQVYADYFKKAFDQYQAQSRKVVERGETMAQRLAETSEASGKEGTRARQ